MKVLKVGEAYKERLSEGLGGPIRKTTLRL